MILPMPEGHTIHRLAGELNRRFAGIPVRVLSPQGRFEDGARQIDGATFGKADADGKHLLVTFGPHRWVHVHLGLFGRVAFGVFGPAAEDKAELAATRSPYQGRDIAYLSGTADVARTSPDQGTPGATPDATRARVDPMAGDADDDEDQDVVDPGEDGTGGPPPPRGAVRMRIIGDGDYFDLRGPTACELLDDAELKVLTDRLGPDPLRRDGRVEEFVRRVHKSRTDIGALLMDQKVVAGIGNVYRAELLYRHGVSPFRAGRDTDEPTLAAMWDDLCVLMRAGVKTGQIITTRKDDRDEPRRRRVPRSDAHYVYKRDGLGCRVCGTVVLTQVMVGRNLFWCPYCQPR